MTELEAERERLATIMDLQVCLKRLEKEGKKSFSFEELYEFLIEYAESVKVHK